MNLAEYTYKLKCSIDQAERKVKKEHKKLNALERKADAQAARCDKARAKVIKMTWELEYIEKRGTIPCPESVIKEPHTGDER